MKGYVTVNGRKRTKVMAYTSAVQKAFALDARYKKSAVRVVIAE